MIKTRRALVLGGGGFPASAWEIGLLAGMAASGVDLRDSDLFVGTSAGARVALHLASGANIEDVFQQQFGPVTGTLSLQAKIDWPKVRREWAQARNASGDSAAILRRVGALALANAGDDSADRRKTIATQIPVHDWPEKNLRIVAVNAETGERKIFDRNSGVDLVDAIAATTAFFGWPPAFIQGHYYIDGGYYSSDNADLATGFAEVYVLALRAPVPSLNVVTLDQTVNVLRATGAQVKVIHPNKETLAAFTSFGGPSVRGPAAKAGYAQGQRIVEEGGVR